MHVPSVLSTLRRPAHTGPNRCWPCTVANLLLLAAFTALVAVFVPAGHLAGAVVVAVGATAIWSRGYLVPYTPHVAPRLTAHLPGDPFHPDGPGGGDETGPPAPAEGRAIADVDPTETGEAVLRTLVEAGVVAATEEEVALDREFETRWHSEMERLRDADLADLAAATRAVSPAVEADALVVRDQPYVVLSDGSGDAAGESWLRPPVAIAETAAARTLAEYDVPDEQVPAAADALRLFLETCPACGDELQERRAGGCCGPPQRGPEGDLLRASVCPSCATQVATFE